jgi:hypothetical protein
MYSASYFCIILIKLQFSWQILQKIPNTKFTNVNPLGAEFCTDRCMVGQTDDMTEDKTLFAALWMCLKILMLGELDGI